MTSWRVVAGSGGMEAAAPYHSATSHSVNPENPEPPYGLSSRVITVNNAVVTASGCCSPLIVTNPGRGR
jgi:hypothetical protein